MTHLGATGHCRLGWSTKKGELQAPVGYDEHSLAYRDLEGSKVHKALREDYGAPFAEVCCVTPYHKHLCSCQHIVMMLSLVAGRDGGSKPFSMATHLFARRLQG